MTSTPLVPEKTFKARMLLPHGEQEIEVCSFNGLMAVMVCEGPVLITKQQVMDFFDLSPSIIPSAIKSAR